MEISDELIQTKIKESLPKIVEDIFGSAYSSPLKKVVDEILKEKEGLIKTLVTDIFTKAFNDESFKAELGKMVLGKMVEKGLKN